MNLPIKKYIAFLEECNYRWSMLTRGDSKYIYVRDRDNRNTRISLKPRRIDSDQDCEWVCNKIKIIDQGFWSDDDIQEEELNIWQKDEAAIKGFLQKRNKGSTNKNYFSLLKQLKEKQIKQSYKAINEWLKEKQCGTKPFQTRLEFIRQLQKFYGNPAWFTDEQYRAIRDLHAEQRKELTRNLDKQDLRQVRGIVSKEEAENYLDKHFKEFPWQCWAIAMMMCYGLRNHELWYIKKLENLFIEVPRRLTKSNADRIVWPAFAEWDERYGLFENFDEHQFYLRWKRKPRIKSISNPLTRTYSIDDEDIYFDGIGDNNDELGEYLTRNTLGIKHQNIRYGTLKGRFGKTGPTSYGKKGRAERSMPPLLVKSPVKRSRKKIEVRPYDLRHTWAVFMHTDPAFKRLKTVEECAEAMGHGLAVHKQEYLLWLNKEDEKKAMIRDHQHPYAA
tara:strand:- start:345 stop:1682 length:1338 start_codon:yes stop_codon:yes gene_type:complete